MAHVKQIRWYTRGEDFLKGDSIMYPRIQGLIDLYNKLIEAGLNDLAKPVKEKIEIRIKSTLERTPQ